jgi:hypothetical protein
MISFSVLFAISTPESLFTNSVVAHWLYHNTGIHKHRDSAVERPKLSFVKFIVHLAFFILSIIFGGFRHVKDMFFLANFLSSSSSGPLPMIING